MIPDERRWFIWPLGFITRTYDFADFSMQRPIHPHMTVAVPTYNTTKRNK